MVNGKNNGADKPFDVDSHNLERRLARAVLSLVRSHRETVRRHRAMVITVFVDIKTGEIKESYILAGRE